jgi:hypothetical protein
MTIFSRAMLILGSAILAMSHVVTHMDIVVEPVAVVLRDHLLTAPLPMMSGTTPSTPAIVPTALFMKTATPIAATVSGSVFNLRS